LFSEAFPLRSRNSEVFSSCHKKAKPPPLQAGACELQSELLPRPEEKSSEAYCVGLEAVVFAALVFFVFAALVFFVFVALVVSCPPVSCANTGIASEVAIIAVKSNVRSFFMLGLDLLRNYFIFCRSKARAIFP